MFFSSPGRDSGRAVFEFSDARRRFTASVDSV
jgi:hypothetical protein